MRRTFYICDKCGEAINLIGVMYLEHDYCVSCFAKAINPIANYVNEALNN